MDFELGESASAKLKEWCNLRSIAFLLFLPGPSWWLPLLPLPCTMCRRGSARCCRRCNDPLPGPKRHPCQIQYVSPSCKNQCTRSRLTVNCQRNMHSLDKLRRRAKAKANSKRLCPLQATPQASAPCGPACSGTSCNGCPSRCCMRGSERKHDCARASLAATILLNAGEKETPETLPRCSIGRERTPQTKGFNVNLSARHLVHVTILLKSLLVAFACAVAVASCESSYKALFSNRNKVRSCVAHQTCNQMLKIGYRAEPAVEQQQNSRHISEDLTTSFADSFSFQAASQQRARGKMHRSTTRAPCIVITQDLHHELPAKLGVNVIATTSNVQAKEMSDVFVTSRYTRSHLQVPPSSNRMSAKRHCRLQ